MSEGYNERYIAEDGTPMVRMYVWCAEAGEMDYIGSMPEHWGPDPEEYLACYEEEE